jgi:hypothetical protein
MEIFEANATTFSFGPWVTCHCAHGVVEEPEVRIHADEALPWDGDVGIKPVEKYGKM